ncbi:MAG TPA: hypothetical protein VH643_12180 [Gemmataceae bacterium]|jgi:hypothetical protein
MNGIKKLLGRAFPAVLVTALLGSAQLPAQEHKVAPGQAVTINVAPAAPAAPPASFILGPRHGHVTPTRQGCTHTGGGNIDVAQPTPDTLIVTMSGVAVAYGSVCDAYAAQNFDLEQAFEVSFDNPKLKKAKLTMEARVIGLLRTHGKADTASYDHACAGVVSGPTALVSLCVPPHSVSGGESLSVNDHDGPVNVPIVAGKYCLRQTFVVSAMAHKCLLCKGPSAEFAPDPALDPLWISYKEPFHGAIKKDFGFQVILKVAEDTDPPANGDKDKGEPEKEKLPEPKAVK